MIPKIIHYCWFGPAEIPDESRQLIKEWKELHPDWTILQWNESNSPMELPYLQNAMAEKRYANVSNLVRLHALREMGGIYLDTDMKLVKPLDILCENRCFFGFEEGSPDTDLFWVNNAICGAEKNHPFISKMHDKLLLEFDGTEEANQSSPRLTTSLLQQERNLTRYGFQQLEDLTLYPREYFYPIHYSEAYKLSDWSKHIYPQTMAIHLWARTWLDKPTLLHIIDELNRELNNSSNNPGKNSDAAAYKFSISRILVENLSAQLIEKEKTLQDLGRLLRQQQEQLFGEFELKSALVKLEHDLDLKQALLQQLTSQLETSKKEQHKAAEEADSNKRSLLNAWKELNDKKIESAVLKEKLSHLQTTVTRYDQELQLHRQNGERLSQAETQLQELTQLLRKYEIEKSSLTSQLEELKLLLARKEKENQVLVSEQATLRQKQDENILALRQRAAQLMDELDQAKKSVHHWENEASSSKRALQSIRDNHMLESQQIQQEVRSLWQAVQWYQATFEKRALAGILKDRVLQKINKLGLIARKKQGFHKIKKAATSTEFTKRIFCSIVNHNCNENAAALRQDLSLYFDTVVLDSGSDKKEPYYVSLGNVYYSGLLNHSYRMAREAGYDYLLMVCSDVVFERKEIKKMVDNLEKSRLEGIGVYSPASSGRSHTFCKREFGKGFRAVPFTEGFIFLASLKVLDEMLPVDLSVNKFGWGLDVGKGYFSRKKDLLCVIDDGVEVFHPESTGYSNEKAEAAMWSWVQSFKDPSFRQFFTTHIDIIRKGLAHSLKVSVIIPCYNQARYLNSSVRSVLLQNYPHVEILLINDGSTDNTEEVAQLLANQFPQVRYLHKKNGGLGNTRNVGLQQSRGDLVQFLDADDLLSKDKLIGQVYAMLLDKSIEVSYTPYLCFEDGNESNTWTYSRVELTQDPLADLIKNWELDLSIPVHCFLFRKQVLNGIRFDEELPNHEDWLFHIYVAAMRPKYSFIREGLAYYRVRMDSMARDKSLMIKGKNWCLQKAIKSGKIASTYIPLLKERLEAATIS